MKQFGEITTWLKGHISLISLVVLGIGNHFVSDDLFFCPCGEIWRRYVFTFSLAFSPAALLLCFDISWKTVYVLRVINGWCSSCKPVIRPILLAGGWIAYFFLDQKFSGCIADDGTCNTEKNITEYGSLIKTAIAGVVLGISLFLMVGRVVYHICWKKTILTKHNQQIGISENLSTEDSKTKSVGFWKKFSKNSKRNQKSDIEMAPGTEGSKEKSAGCCGRFSKTSDPEEETLKRNLQGLDWEILSLIVDEGLMNAKVLKELKDADFIKFQNKINMGQWKTLKEKCGNINLTTQGSGEMNVQATSSAVDRSASSSADHAADSHRNENSPQNIQMILPPQGFGLVNAEDTATAASQSAGSSASSDADSCASHVVYIPEANNEMEPLC
ncbi:uncharacterized protein LOC112554648 [Pomacea canaliculata]|uniref:uncharacterized protein LOC112554648 n=1 Tax=Pomacea canaliculata TaxID=400727 RepID=UPI000D733B8A|nr:uncharacterized protein LOC112554648 [Pomacea canaliculata]